MDFTVTSGSITFQPSETQKSVTIEINNDSVVEEMEYFFVQLSLPDGSLMNETNVILGAVNRSVVNITDSQDSNPCELFERGKNWCKHVYIYVWIYTLTYILYPYKWKNYIALIAYISERFVPIFHTVFYC